MKRNAAVTPTSRIRSALRNLWLRSRERATALKRDKYTCAICGAKKSTRKGAEVNVQVHHLDGVEWERIIQLVREQLLCDPSKLVTLCDACHQKQERSGQ